MAGWSIRRKLGVLVTIPLIVLLIGGGLLVASLAGQYRQANRAGAYADDLQPVLAAGAALNNEFNVNATDEARTRSRKATDARIKTLQPVLSQLQKGDDSESELPGKAQAVSSALVGLLNARDLIDKRAASGQSVAVGQSDASSTALLSSINNLLTTLTAELSALTPDRSTAANAGLVSAANNAAQAAGQERRLTDVALSSKTGATTTQQTTLLGHAATQSTALVTATATADAQQKIALRNLANLDGRLAQWRDSARQLNPAGNVQVSAFDEFADARQAQIFTIANDAALKAQSTASSAERGALFRVGAVAAAVVLTLLLVTALLAGIARSVTGPLRRLRAGAVEVASVQLPAAVARIEQDGVAADVSLPPVLPAEAQAGPETLEVARAVDDLGAEAVRLATAQVRLRRALDEAFVSMSRRSQSMVEKQLAIIDELESQEQDPDQLRNLFRLDHLAARMRRYNDNLLVLAGSAVRTRATAPVKVAELFRAATSEMEQYERVRLQPVSGASISGTVAGELVHLLAELLDNAAMYSPPSSPIVLSAAFTADGGLQIEVLDAGVGISPGELDRLNARLTQPEAIDTQVPSRMGLFVVARLARRGSFGVMLQSRPDASGTIALARIPATLVIGAPGSTGENLQQMPASVARRPMTPSGGVRPPDRQGGHRDEYAPGAGNPYGPYGQPDRTPVAPAPAPAAAAAGAAAEAAAGVRPVAAEAGESGNGALPRRRRAAAGSGPTAGLPPEAVAAAASPAGDLFSPNTPAAPADEDADRRRFSGPPSVVRGPATPAETSPTGFPSLRTPMSGPQATSPVGLPMSPLGRSLPQRPVSGQPAPDQPARFEGDANFVETPAAGISGLPGLAAPGRAPEAPPVRTGAHGTGASGTGGNGGPAHPDPLTTPSGEFRAPPNRGLANPGLTNPSRHNPGTSAAARNGSDPLTGPGWDDELPTELAARAAAAAGYRPADPDAPMIGDDVRPDFDDPTPIFDQISVWFTAEPTGSMPVRNESDADVIDVREPGERRGSSRWASLGDQRWLATNARAAAAPETEGATEIGLPKRRPGANLLPSAATAAPAQVPPARPGPIRPAAALDPPADEAPDEAPDGEQDADLVRGRLGSYQRGLASARRARTQPAPAPAFDPVGASLFTANSEVGDDAGHHSGDQGGDQ